MEAYCAFVVATIHFWFCLLVELKCRMAPQENSLSIENHENTYATDTVLLSTDYFGANGR